VIPVPHLPKHGSSFYDIGPHVPRSTEVLLVSAHDPIDTATTSTAPTEKNDLATAFLELEFRPGDVHCCTREQPMHHSQEA